VQPRYINGADCRDGSLNHLCVGIIPHFRHAALEVSDEPDPYGPSKEYDGREPHDRRRQLGRNGIFPFADGWLDCKRFTQSGVAVLVVPPT
jgi:hypothetical protein